MGFTVEKGSGEGFSEGGSEKGLSRRRLQLPLGAYDPLGWRPIIAMPRKIMHPL